MLWHPDYFAAKPQLVLKAGFPAYGITGDPNASIDRAEPLILGPQFGAHGATPGRHVRGLRQRLVRRHRRDQLPTRRRRVAVRGCRTTSLTGMAHHGRTGRVTVDPKTAHVTLDGEKIAAQRLNRVTLSRLYLI